MAGRNSHGRTLGDARILVTIRVPTETSPGAYAIAVTLTANDGDTARLATAIEVHEAVLPARHDFPSTTWLYADALCDWYGVAPYSEPFGRYSSPTSPT